MEKSLNRLKKDLNEIATAHKQINSFFWGQWIDAISRDAVDYPLMVCILQPSTMGDNFVEVSLQIVLADKYNQSDYDQINEIHSDLLQVGNDIKTTLMQGVFEDFLEREGVINLNPFINRGHDLTAGWTMDMTLRLFSYDNWCKIPQTGYNYGND